MQLTNLAAKNVTVKIMGAVIAFLVLVSCFLGAGWYVTQARYEGQVHKANSVQTQLELSNASYNSIKGEFSKLSTTLESNQEKALASHAILRANLDKIIENDKSMVATETYLLNRTPETQCVTPKELADVWSKM